MALDLKQPVVTFNGSEVRIYHVYENEMHGAYYEDNKWVAATWMLPNGWVVGKSNRYDLVNE